MHREHYIRQPQPEEDSGAYLWREPIRSLSVETRHNHAVSLARNSFGYSSQKVDQRC
jgi:hypothetical protein